MKTVKCVIAAIVAALVLITGCQLPVNPTMERGAGRLTVAFGGLGGRTLLPEGITLTPSSYSLKATGPGGSVVETSTSEGMVQLQDLAVGTWLLEAKAWSAASDLIGEGSASVVVRKASVESVQVIINPLSGTGTLSLVLKNQYTAVLIDPQITVSLKKGEQPATHPVAVQDGTDRTKWTIETTLDTGAYLVEIQVKQDGIPAWGLTEVAYVYKGLTVAAEFALTVDNVNRRPPAPTQVRVENKDVDFVDLRWKDESAVESQYLVERRLGGETDWPVTPLAVLGENVVSYRDETVEQGVSYQYRVVAKNYWGTNASVDPVSVTVPAQLDIGGSITADQTWTKENVYFIYKNLTIKAGATVTIEPGTKIRIGGNSSTSTPYGFTVEGSLVAEGTVSEPISIVSDFSSTDPLYGTTASARINLKKDSGLTFRYVSARSVGLDVVSTFPVMVDSEVGTVTLSYKETDTDAAKVLDWQRNKMKSVAIEIPATQSAGHLTFQKGAIGALSIKNNSSMEIDVIDNDLGYVSVGAGSSYYQTVAKNTSLTENRIKKANANGVGNFGWDAGLLARSVSNDSSVEFINNVVSGFQYGVHFYEVNDNETDSGHPIIVKGNTITGNTQGIRIEFSPWGVTNSVGYLFEANSITNNTEFGVELRSWGPRDPSVMDEDFPITFTDNYFHNPSGYEIHLGSSDNETLFRYSGIAVHAKNNVWWTDDASEIANKIWDNGLDSDLMEVEILPLTPLGGLQAKSLGPSTGAVWSSSANTFSWTIYGQSTESKLVLSEQADLSAPVLSIGSLTGTSHVLTAAEAASLVTGKTYYWRVEAKDKAGVWYNGAIRSLQLSLPSVTLQEPAAGAVLLDGRTPEFSWTTSAAAIRYHLIVSTSSDLAQTSHRVIDNDQVFGLSYLTPESLAPGQTYYWAVEALDANGLPGSRSELRSFRIPEPGLALTLDSSLAGAQHLTLGSGELVLVRGDTLVLSASADKVPTQVEWSLNGELLSTTSGPQISEVLDVSPGRYTLDAVATIQGQTYSSSIKIRVVPNRFWSLSSSFSEDTSYRNAAVINASGQLYLAGGNARSQLAVEGAMSRNSPARVVDPDWSGLRSVVLSSYGGAMVLTKTGSVYYWGGDGWAGEGSPWSGDPNFTTSVSDPLYHANLTGISQLSLGFSVGMALTNQGRVLTWGSDFSGFLGQGNYTGAAFSPKQVPSLSSIIGVKVSAGSYDGSAGLYWYPTAYALASNGKLYAWGNNSRGQLGNGQTFDTATPAVVPGLPTILAFDSGWGHTVAVDKDGSVWTWGWNGNGQLGNGNTTYQKSPVQIAGLPPVKTVAVSSRATFALDQNGDLWAWGWGEETGLGSNVAEKTPRQVLLPADVLKIFPLMRGLVVQDVNNQLWFWGEESSGLFSKEVTGTALLPVAIEGRF